MHHPDRGEDLFVLTGAIEAHLPHRQALGHCGPGPGPAAGPV